MENEVKEEVKVEIKKEGKTVEHHLLKAVLIVTALVSVLLVTVTIINLSKAYDSYEAGIPEAIDTPNTVVPSVNNTTTVTDNSQKAKIAELENVTNLLIREIEFSNTDESTLNSSIE